MNCTPNLSRFRLLNYLVGWDEETVEGLAGLNSVTGLQLQPVTNADDSLSESALSLWFPPSRLAKSCGTCEWYLVTPGPPHSRLLKRGVCEPCWAEPQPGARTGLQYARALAVSPHRIAVTDSTARSIFFFANGDCRQLGQVPFSQPGAIAYTGWGEWLVVDEQMGILRCLDLAGVDLGPFGVALPPEARGAVDRLAVDEKYRVWIAVKGPNGYYRLWCANQNGSKFNKATLAELQQAFKPSGLGQVTDEGFCFEDDRDPDNKPSCGTCFSWYGRPLDSPPIVTISPLFVKQGQILTLAIDSGIPRCRWHRVRMDADMPSGTTVAIAVSTNEQSNPTPQGVAAGEWSTFAPGVPHPADWQEAVLNSDDFLVRQPPGRYLFLRIRLTGDGLRTPRVQRLRFDFPRQTSLDQLPSIYRENPETEDFTERFLSLFDAFLENIDSAIERLPALLDSDGVPESLLPWLGLFLDIAMDPSWDAGRRRRILQAAPKLYRMRGTVDGMRTAIHLVFDVDPIIQEPPLERPWGAVGGIRLNGGTRLFGRSVWRFRLGHSQLSKAPLRSFGNPDRDPFNALAHRFIVLVPMVLNTQSVKRLQQLIDAQKPAHTVVTLRGAGNAFILGRPISLGIDTVFKPFAPSVLPTGEQELSLGRETVLSAARGESGQGLRLGQGAAVSVKGTLR